MSRIPYRSVGPRGTKIDNTLDIEQYVEQFKRRDFPPNDVRIHNKRLLFIYPIWLDDSLLDDIFGDWNYLVLRYDDRTYVAVQLIDDDGEVYRGSLFDFAIDVDDNEDDPLLPEVRTIFQSEWSSVDEYFRNKAANQPVNNRRNSKSSIKVEVPKSTIDNTWTTRINRVATPEVIVWYSRPGDITMINNLVTDLENANWLAINSTDVDVIMNNIIDSQGIIFYLGRTYRNDVELYRILQWLMDGRIAYRGQLIKFNPVPVVVVAGWNPDTDYIDNVIVNKII